MDLYVNVCASHLYSGGGVPWFKAIPEGASSQGLHDGKEVIPL